ncbi:response regulator transcription factor [Actinomadura sp. 9N215]|uniref:response regulator transcription factor n=1 Tax=Actinomadura sp. 9N215 TaxID=3375150 RepID=UPI0037AF75AB
MHTEPDPDPECRYRVLVVDDNAFIRAGLASALEAAGDIDVVGEAGDGREAEELARRLAPDVVLLDVRMPRTDGVRAAAALSRVSRVIMLTQVEEPDVVLAAVRNGAVGYLVHNTFTVGELAEAIRDTVRHRAHPLSQAASAALIDAARTGRTAAPAGPADRARFGLSAREAQVMELIVRGHSNHDIAAKLVLTEKTVKNYINRIYAKLGAPNRATAIVTWLGMPPGD